MSKEEIGDANDFTFCQVVSQRNEDELGSPKAIPNVSSISISDSPISRARGLSISKPEVDGSNTFKVVDTLPQKFTVTLPSKKQAVGDSFHACDGQEAIKEKPVARKKIPFEKGFSQMDWLRITQKNSDLAGLKGQSNARLISLDEVKKHKTGGSIWTVLKGRVYNISPYMKFHPGGVDMLMKAAGKDCTSLFNKYHAWVNAEFLLEKCLVGILDECQ